MPSLKKSKDDFMRMESVERERDKDRDGKKSEPQAAINSLTKHEIFIADEHRHPKAWTLVPSHLQHISTSGFGDFPAFFLLLFGWVNSALFFSCFWIILYALWSDYSKDRSAYIIAQFATWKNLSSAYHTHNIQLTPYTSIIKTVSISSLMWQIANIAFDMNNPLMYDLHKSPLKTRRIWSLQIQTT